MIRVKSISILVGLALVGSLAHAQTRQSLSPSASEIQAYLIKYRMQVLQTIADMKISDTSQIGVDIVNFASARFRVQVTPDTTTSPRRLNVVISSTTGDDVSNVARIKNQDPIQFAALANEVRNFPYPSSTANMTAGQWRQHVKPITDKVQAVINECSQRNQAPKKIHWFEVIPLQFECRAMITNNLKQWLDQLMIISEPDGSFEIPSDSDNDPNRTSFTRAKRDLAIELAVGALFQKIQYDVHVDSTKVFARNKARCFPLAGSYVQNVIASLSVPFEKLPSAPGYRYQTSVGDMVMPEPLYALGQYQRYYNGDAGNRLLIFNNMTDATGQNVARYPNVEINRDDVRKNGLFFSPNGSLHFQFNVRDLHNPGRSCHVMYCQQPNEPLSPMAQGS